MIAGQLYRVWFIGRERRADDTLVSEKQILVVADSVEDVYRRFPYLFDISDFDSWSITQAAKEPDRCAVVSSATRSVPHNHPDAVIKRDDRTDDVKQRELREGRKFMVALSTIVFARDERHAHRKLKARIQEADPRITEFVEEVHVSDGIAKPRDVSIFTKAHIIGFDRSMQ